MTFRDINAMACKAAGIRPADRNYWPSVTIVDSAPMPQCAIAPSQMVYIDLCTAIEKLARMTAEDARRGSLVAADHGRELMFQMVSKLGPAMVDIVEEFGGPTENCRQCGDLVALCRCEDIPFAED